MTGTIAGKMRQTAGKTELSDHLLGVSERLIDGQIATTSRESTAEADRGVDMELSPPGMRGEARLVVGERFDSHAKNERVPEKPNGTNMVMASPLHPAVSQVSPLYRFGKRALDLVGAGLALVVLAPVFLILSALIRLGSPGPIFHRRRVLAQQQYDGRTTSTYDAFKFRTMIVNADGYLKANPQLLAEYSKDYKLSNDPRVTRVGAPLRRLSLDELPQLWNILRGQMSLVGPRMISPPELDMYGADAARLLSVKPGLTGLWQVSGRTNLPYQERVHLDMYYIENRSLWLDIEILARTVGCVLARRGAV